MLFIFLCLTYFSWYDHLYVHPCCYKWHYFIPFFFLFHSFLWLTDITLENICNIFFIHSSVDRHLGSFHVLAVISNIVMNIGVYISFQIKVFVFSGLCLGVGLLDHMQLYFYFFEELPCVLSIEAVPIYIQTNSVGGCPFLCTLSSLYYVSTFS